MLILLIPTGIYAQGSTNCSEAKAIAAQALTNAEQAQALAARATKQRDDAIEQRDQYAAELLSVRTQRDQTAGELIAAQQINVMLAKRADDLAHQNAKLEAQLSDGSTMRWIIIGAVAVVSGAAASFVTYKITQ